MAELLDRGFQRHLLQAAAGAYPSSYYLDNLGVGDARTVRVNASYLAEHGLINYFKGSEGGLVRIGQSATITAKGIDFIADDGGLSAILGVLTVRLHEDTLKQIVAAKIQASELDQPDKQKYLDRLQELPADATKHLVLRLIDAGLENWHRALPMLQNVLGGG